MNLKKQSIMTRIINIF